LFSNSELPHSENDFSHLGHYFDNPNGQKLASGVVNLPSKSRQNPTVNESGIDVLVKLLFGKRDLFSNFILSLFQNPLSFSLSSSTKICDK
jgi:hypothetical protein